MANVVGVNIGQGLWIAEKCGSEAEGEILDETTLSRFKNHTISSRHRMSTLHLLGGSWAELEWSRRKYVYIKVILSSGFAVDICLHAQIVLYYSSSWYIDYPRSHLHTHTICPIDSDPNSLPSTAASGTTGSDSDIVSTYDRILLQTWHKLRRI